MPAVMSCWVDRLHLPTCHVLKDATAMLLQLPDGSTHWPQVEPGNPAAEDRGRVHCRLCRLFDVPPNQFCSGEGYVSGKRNGLVQHQVRFVALPSASHSVLWLVLPAGWLVGLSAAVLVVFRFWSLAVDVAFEKSRNGAIQWSQGHMVF